MSNLKEIMNRIRAYEDRNDVEDTFRDVLTYLCDAQPIIFNRIQEDIILIDPNRSIGMSDVPSEFTITHLPADKIINHREYTVQELIDMLSSLPDEAKQKPAYLAIVDGDNNMMSTGFSIHFDEQDEVSFVGDRVYGTPQQYKAILAYIQANYSLIGAVQEFLGWDDELAEDADETNWDDVVEEIFTDSYWEDVLEDALSEIQ